MRIRCTLVLPLVGLLLFGAESYHSFRFQRASGRYFWWSSIRLDSDPLERQSQTAAPCKDLTQDCVALNPVFHLVDPGWLEKFLMYSAYPAFVVGAVVIGGLSWLGISEVLSFMVFMPLLISAWYCFVGWLLDRWQFKRLPPASS